MLHFLIKRLLATLPVLMVVVVVVFLIVQGTFVAAIAVLTEAILSFLGLGLPALTPTWGNFMAEGRLQCERPVIPRQASLISPWFA